MNTPTAQRCMRKLLSCIALARQCSRDSWQQDSKYRRENLRIRKEAMQDARYWKAQP